ncbi:MAG: retropepsin-like domain-containing protein [Pyrinomonadaceae bacterium]|nr:retropepsin-like domain-containing protein [Pyrinomonadaceae bacterium]
MRHQLAFTELVNYDAGQPSITVTVTLSVSQTRVDCAARVDTGSSNCIFARNLGEELGLDIETGLRLVISTVTGTFVAYLHEVNLSLASFEFSGLVAFAEDREFQRNVLGRRGFIEQMTLGLVDYEGKLYLGRYDE